MNKLSVVLRNLVRGNFYLRQFGRLVDGATLEPAQAELDTIAASLVPAWCAARVNPIAVLRYE